MRFPVVLLLVSFAAAAKGKSAAQAASAVGRPVFVSRGPRKVSCSKYKVLTASDGYIVTTGSKYGNFESCSWKIIVPATKRVRLHFDKFDLEYGRPSCPYDKLKVYDGSDAKATLKGTYCGSKKPKDDIISKGNTIFVTFSSDYSVVKSGFRIRFSVVSCTEGELHGLHGVFGTGRSPYGNNEFCSWYILVPPKKRVRIRFTRFDLENHPSCRYDNVSVVRTIHWTTFCGKNKPVDQVYWRRDMGVNFVSDSSRTFRGFTAEYFAVTCKLYREITPTSPWLIVTLPPNYENRESCSWKITAPAHKRVRLVRVRFELEAHGACRYDSLKVYDGSDDKAPLRGTYCGTHFPTVLISSGRSIFLKFKSDSTKKLSGFYIKHLFIN